MIPMQGLAQASSACDVLRRRRIPARRRRATSTTRVRIDPDSPATFPEERFDPAAADGTTEAAIAVQQQEDDAEAMQDMARYARRVRRCLGLSQVEVARRINVPHETIRNREQGKRRPTGAAKALLRVLGKAPEMALRVST